MARTRTEDREYIPIYVRQQVLCECNRICAHCGTKLRIGDNFTLEHVIPLNKGGKNETKNYVALCKTCNKDKSDDIVEPNEYYTYLPKEKKAQLQAIFEEYLKTTDWLGYNNLFRTDRFDLQTVVPILIKGRQVDAPITFRVEKAKRNVTFEYLTLYTGHLSTDDKQMMIYDERDITQPYYKITKAGETVMFVSVYIMKKSVNDMPEDNIVHLDLYINPELVEKKTTVPVLYNITQALLSEIQRTLMFAGQASIIKCMIRTPNSDKFGTRVLHELYRLEPQTYEIGRLYMNPNELGGCVLCLCTTLFQGTFADLKHEAKAQGFDSVKDFYDHVDRTAMSESINTRLGEPKEIPKRQPTKVKKKDKKRKGKR